MPKLVVPRGTNFTLELNDGGAGIKLTQYIKNDDKIKLEHKYTICSLDGGATYTKRQQHMTAPEVHVTADQLDAISDEQIKAGVFSSCNDPTRQVKRDDLVKGVISTIALIDERRSPLQVFITAKRSFRWPTT